MQANTIITAGRVHTMDPATDAITAIATRDGRIVAIGGWGDVAELQGPDTILLDYRDATIVPGLTDSHTHVVLGLDLARGINLTDQGPLATIQRVVEDAARHATGDGWVLGWGLDPNVFVDVGFQGRVFDEASSDVPIFLRMRDGHSAIVNTAALAAAGVADRPIAFPDGSMIAVDERGVPTGYLLEFGAIDHVRAVIPIETLERRADRLVAQLEAMAATGIASTHVLDMPPDTVDLMEIIENRGDLPLRLRISPMVMAGSDETEWERVLGRQGQHGRRWAVEGVKFLIDGTIDNGSAWLERPDCYGQGTTSVWRDPGEYTRALHYFARRGVPTATHAIGDRGVRHVLDAIAGLGEDIRQQSVHRVEHIETIPDELVVRFAELDVVASMQPVHGTHHTRADRSDNWSVRLGEERAARGWRCRDLREAGVTLALGSDWPITPYDPRAMMADSILRRPVERPEMAPVQPSQALTPLMALEGYTSHAARAAGEAAVAGSIAVGKRADLTVFAADPLAVTAQELACVPVITTVLDGWPVLPW